MSLHNEHVKKLQTVTEGDDLHDVDNGEAKGCAQVNSSICWQSCVLFVCLLFVCWLHSLVVV